MNTDTLDHLYSEALTEVLESGPSEPEGIPTLPELMAAIRETVGDEKLAFPSFELFFDWWDVTTAYDQMDENASAAAHKPILKVAYQGLVAEGLF